MATDDALTLLRAHAPRLCAAAGVSYPAQLLHEGLPSAEERGVVPPEENLTLDEIISWWVTRHPNRKAVGLFLTPRPVARELIEKVAEGRFHPASVLDPAVGAGVFLTEALRQFGPNVELYGVDRDPFAVAATRMALWIAAAEIGNRFRSPRPLIERVRLADALLDEEIWNSLAGDQGFDLVCGNPPFGNGIEKRTARSQEERSKLKLLYPEAARGPYDRSVVFTQLGTKLLSKKGRLAFLVPRSILAARYATGLRELMAREAPLTRLDLHPGDRPVADADIAMVTLHVRRGRVANAIQVSRPDGQRAEQVARSVLTPSTWGGLIHPHAELIARTSAKHPTLDQFFLVRSGASVAEAYKIVCEIREDGEGWRFLTAGLIARYVHRWGERTARHLGHRFTRPILPVDATSLSDRRRHLYDAPKIIVAGLSSVLRAFSDEASHYAASVGTFLVLPLENGEGGRRLLRRGLLLLNSAWLSEVHRCRAGPMALAGGNLPLGRRDLEAFPCPVSIVDDDPKLAILDEAFERLSRGFDPEYDLRIQQTILELAGFDAMESETLLDLYQERVSSPR